MSGIEQTIKERGIELGRLMVKKAAARELLLLGDPIEKIVRITGLPIEDVITMQEALKKGTDQLEFRCFLPEKWQPPLLAQLDREKLNGAAENRLKAMTIAENWYSRAVHDATELLRAGRTPKEAAQSTGLPLEEVQEIYDSMQEEPFEKRLLGLLSDNYELDSQGYPEEDKEGAKTPADEEHQRETAARRKARELLKQGQYSPEQISEMTGLSLRQAIEEYYRYASYCGGAEYMAAQTADELLQLKVYSPAQIAEITGLPLGPDANEAALREEIAKISSARASEPSCPNTSGSLKEKGCTAAKTGRSDMAKKIVQELLTRGDLSYDDIRRASGIWSSTAMIIERMRHDHIKEDRLELAKMLLSLTSLSPEKTAEACLLPLDDVLALQAEASKAEDKS
jgi:hypothetical protein